MKNNIYIGTPSRAYHLYKTKFKGSVREKIKEGIGLRQKIFDGDCYLYLLSVASIMRKFLKTTHTKERSVNTNSESCNIQLG